MIRWKGAGRVSSTPVLSGRHLTLTAPTGWLTGEESSCSPDLALKLSAVYRCVAVLSDAMGEMPVSVRNWRTREDVQDHYLGKVLWQRPNPAMTPFIYKNLMERNRILRGNAYSYIRRDGNGRPIELIPLPPDYVTVNLDSRGDIWYGYAAPDSGISYALDNMEVLHYKNYTNDGLVGISTLHYAARTIATAHARETYDQAVYKNGGNPGGVLYTDADLNGEIVQTLSDGSTSKVRHRDIVRSEWERAHGGAANAFRIAVLDHGLKYQPVSVTNADAQFLESKEFSILDICRFFGVPPHKVFAGDQSYESNEANTLGFITDTLQPNVTQCEEEDKWKLLPTDEVNDGLKIHRNMMVSLRGDSAARAAWYGKMREIGYYSVNDIRRIEGDPDVPGGDTRYSSLNYIPLERFDELSVARNTNGGAPL